MVAKKGADCCDLNFCCFVNSLQPFYACNGIIVTGMQAITVTSYHLSKRSINIVQVLL